MEFTLVLLALMLPVYLLSNQIEKVNIIETNPNHNLQDWLQAVI